jgi:leucyl-tRNA synthetase
MKTSNDKQEKELNYWRHTGIKGVSEDSGKMQFNTAIARIMEFYNALSKYLNEKSKNLQFLKECAEDFIKLLAPFAPHFAEEQWNKINPSDFSDNSYSVFNQSWPLLDPDALVKDEIEIAIQINGKIMGRVNVSSIMGENEIKDMVLGNTDIMDAVKGRTVTKVIVVKGRLVNIVVK